MLRFISIAVLTAGLFATSFAQNGQSTIQWMTWDEAVAQWKQDMAVWNAEPDPKKKVPPKKFFVDVYTGWCGWCKKMDASTFKDPNIVAIMNQHFYPVKLDAEMKQQLVWDNHTFVNPAPEGKRGTHQFAASLLDNKLSYPSYAILDENARRVSIYNGYKQTPDLLGILLFFGTNQYMHYREYLEKQPKQPQSNSN